MVETETVFFIFLIFTRTSIFLAPYLTKPHMYTVFKTREKTRVEKLKKMTETQRDEEKTVRRKMQKRQEEDGEVKIGHVNSLFIISKYKHASVFTDHR